MQIGNKILKLALVAFVVVLCITGCCADSVDIVPPGLAPGTPYRLVFLTGSVFNGYSGDVNYYDALVTQAADSVPALDALGTQWSAIVSTEDNGAAYNLIDSDPGVPIYNLAGQLVALDATRDAGGLFGGPLRNPIDVYENGVTSSFALVWTGSSPDGDDYYPWDMGTWYSIVGWAQQVDSQWLHTSIPWGASGMCHLYGISSDLTAPVPTPEPSNLAVLGIGLAGIAGAVRRKLLKQQTSEVVPTAALGGYPGKTGWPVKFD
jgi:hypothetical protein